MTSLRGYQHGVTLLELLVVMVILGILAAMAAPYMGDYVERQRWVGATEALYGELQQAKRAAISNNKQIYFKVSGTASTDWCAGYGESSSCDCLVANSCQVNGQTTLSVSSADYSGIGLFNKTTPVATNVSGSFIMPGVSASSASIVVRSDSLGDIEIDIGASGRVKVCSDDLGQYPDC